MCFFLPLRYGPIFRTSLAGRPVVVSADPEFNSYLFQQEGRSVELWYLDTFSKIFVHEGDSKTNAVGIVHKYVRSIFLNHFGAERLKEKLLPEIQEFVTKSLCSWSSQESVEVKHAGSVVNFYFSTYFHLLSAYDLHVIVNAYINSLCCRWFLILVQSR